MKIADFLKSIADPRMDRRKRHSLSDIVGLTIISVICGAEGWESIAEFGKAKIDFLRLVLELPNGIPSHDTIERLFKRIKPSAFAEAFHEFVVFLGGKTKGMVVNFDGKVLCGTRDDSIGKEAITMVSAWVNENQMVFAQVKVEGKSNEITALHQLIAMLDLEGSMVTIDAIGCQKDITQEIVEAKADYVIGLKENQKSLFEQVESLFSFQKSEDVFEKTEKNGGRIETRKCSVIQSLEFLDEIEKWPTIKTIIKIESIRELKGKTSRENRYYISSKKESAQYFNNIVRGHWGIENAFHWVLDVGFGEDRNRKRKDNAGENFAYIRRMALNLLKKDTSTRMGLQYKRLKAGWDQAYLLKILNF